MPTGQPARNRSVGPTEPDPGIGDLTLPRSERRVVSVVFADVAGFTAVAEVIDHEELTQLMYECWEVLDEVLHQHGAVVDKHIGDAVLATFGSQAAREDDPVRAVRAGLAMQVAFGTFSAEVERETGLALALRSAVTMGEVTVGVVAGSTTEVSVTGPAVNRASRLQGAAMPGSVLVDEPIHWSSSWAIEYGEPTAFDLKGIEGLVKAWPAVRTRDTRARLDRPPPPDGQLVGRDEEFQVLAGLVANLTRDNGSTVAVVGDPGVGKSALVAHVRRFAESQGIRWLDARAQSYASAEPYGVLRQLLRDLLYLPGEADAELVRGRLTGLLGEDREPRAASGATMSRDDRMALLEYALGIPPETGAERKSFDTNPSLRRRLVEQAVADAIGDLARSGSLVVSVEDTHWCDELSAGAIRAIAQACPALLLLQSRADDDQVVGLGGATRVLRLAALGSEHGATLAARALSALVPDRPHVAIEESAARLLLDAAGGNPYFIVEVVRLLLGDGRLVIDGDTWRLRDEVTDDRQVFPSTIRQLMTAQVDQVDARDRPYLQLASVIGVRFERSLLMAVSGNPDEAAAACDSLLDARVITFPDGEESAALVMRGVVDLAHVFRHGMLREAAYDMLSRRDRRRFHGLVARSLAEAYGAWPTGGALALLAHHHVLGDDPVRAAHAAILAGEAAGQAFANQEARRWFRSALVALDERARATARRGQAAPAPFAATPDEASRHRALCGLAAATLAIGEAEAARASLLEALELAGRIPGVAPGVPEICRRIARTYELGGASYATALEWVDRGLQFAGAAWPDDGSVTLADGSAPDPSATARLCLIAGLARMRLGEYPAALTWASRAMHLAGAADSAPGDEAVSLGLDLAQAHNLRCILDQLQGNALAALAAGEESLRRYEVLGDLVGQEKAHGNVADALLDLGRTRDAISHFERSQALARRVGDPVRMAASLLNVGQALVVVGEERRALAGYERALEVLDRIGHVEGASICRTNMAGTCVPLGDPERALELLDAAEQGFGSVGATGHLSELERVRAGALATVGASRLAVAAAGRAIDHAVALGRRVEEGAAYRARAIARAADGEGRDDVHADFARSGELLEALGARYEMAQTYLAWARHAASAPGGAEAGLARQLATEASRLFQEVDALARARAADEAAAVT